MKPIYIALFLGFGVTQNVQAEDLEFHCVPRNDREEPYRTFDIRIENADSRNPASTVWYKMFDEKDSPECSSSGVLDNFARDEVYTTQITQRYRMIRIEGGELYSNWERDVLQLQKRTGRNYKGLFDFPEGSDQLDLSWNSTLVLVCERTL